MSVARVPWTADAVQKLRRALPIEAIDLISRERAVDLLEYQDPNLLLAVRTENGERGLEVCVIGIAGRGVANHWPAFVALCQGNGVTRIRAHTDAAKPAVQRLWRRLGFHADQIVYYRDLSHGT